MNSLTVYFSLLAALCCAMHTSALPTTRLRKETAIAKVVKIVVKVGEPIEIICAASGTYAPAFHWLFNGRFLQQGPLDRITSNIIAENIVQATTRIQTRMYIRSAKLEDSGKYTCVADTLIHRVTKSHIVEVQQTDKVATATPADASDLAIYQWTTDIQQNEGSPLHVVCRATQGNTNAAPTIKWTLGDKEVKESDNIKIRANGDLDVLQVTEDFHWWNALTCHAISTDGRKAVTKPVFVYIMSLEDETSNSH